MQSLSKARRDSVAWEHLPLLDRQQIRLFLEERQQFLEVRMSPRFRHAVERIEWFCRCHFLASDGFALDRRPQIPFDRVVFGIVADVWP